MVPNKERVARRVAIALACAAIAPLCRSAAQSVHDSAGMKIVENRTPLMSASGALRLSSQPVIELDPDAGADYAFGGVEGVLRLTDGRIVVAARTDPQFRLFDAKGRLLHATNEQGTADRANRERHSLVKLHGDTIAVPHNRYVLLFVVAGNSLRQVSAPSEPPREMPRELRVNVLSNGGGAFATFPSPAKHAPGTQWADSTGFVLRNSKGELIRDLGRLPYITFEMTKTEMTSVWLSPIGASCAGAGRFYYGFGNTYAMQAYSESGKLESIIRRAWTPSPVTGADWEHWVVDWSKLWVRERGADSLPAIQRVRESPYAFELPAFASCLVASDGGLWIREAHLDDAISAGSLSDDPIVPSRWSVFNSEGRWISDITMPTGFQPTDIGADYVAGRFRRAPGRMTAVVYRYSADAR